MTDQWAATMAAEDSVKPRVNDDSRLSQSDRRAARIVAAALEDSTGFRWIAKP